MNDETTPQDRPTRFTCRNARSPELLTVLGIAIGAETLVFHVLLAHAHPLLAIFLDVLSGASLIWLIRDYVALGRSSLRIAGGTLHLAIGHRLTAAVPLSEIDVTLASSSSAAASAFNVTKPVPPNITLTFHAPRTVAFLGLPRTLSALSLHVDEPARFVVAAGSAPE